MAKARNQRQRRVLLILKPAYLMNEEKNPLLVVDGVTRTFGGLRAVNECSLVVQEGSITGLIGPNGAGKTTLFNIISGFLKPTSGHIWFDGHRINGLSAHAVFRRGLVRTFQIPRELGTMSVLENLMLVPAGRSVNARTRRPACWWSSAPRRWRRTAGCS